MTNNYLLDTNVVIRVLEPTSDQELVFTLLESAQVFISSITVAEVVAGVDEERKQRFLRLRPLVRVVDVTEAIATQAGLIRQQLVKTKKVFLVDCVIAATAQQLGAELLTHDRDFKQFPALNLYQWP